MGGAPDAGERHGACGMRASCALSRGARGRRLRSTADRNKPQKATISRPIASVVVVACAARPVGLLDPHVAVGGCGLLGGGGPGGCSRPYASLPCDVRRCE